MAADQYVYDFDAPPPGDADTRLKLLGGKGANLAVMATELRLPVPPGFTVTTRACQEYLRGEWPETLDAELRSHIARLGDALGRRFGDPANPLLVSVRSGAPVSMPGMMDTILNLGLTTASLEGFARVSGNAAFAADCLRRLREGYRAVIGTGDVPDDPWQQLRDAVEAVFRSWNSERARTYRKVERIPDDLGTAVTVQAMVFGNRGEDSGTGVVFTRNPSTGERSLFGDVLFNAQGEDVVAGTHATEPIAALADRLPRVWEELTRYADVLERHYADMCDIEFTIEDGRLWMLQVRVGKRSPRAALRICLEMAEDQSFPLSREQAVVRAMPLLVEPPREFVRAADAPQPITRGLPASPGVASGVIATSADAAEHAADAGERVILVRPETSPEDVRGMARSAGVLTARGGLASHAAVVARGWGIPAVVGAASITVSDRWIAIDGKRMAAGEPITIDGSSGEVFDADLRGVFVVAPEAATLLAWAAELGIDVTKQDAPTASEESHGSSLSKSGPDLTAEDVARVLLVKGSASADQLAESVLAPTDRVSSLVEDLVSDGTCERTADQVRLTGAGKLRAAELISEERDAAIDADRAAALLDEFHALDGRMKQIVTGWQVREVGGEQVLNDHTDATYDRQLLDEMAALHGDVANWLNPLCASSRQFDVYRSRLTTALEQARGGDQRFVASPRVDSYHSVWFELHEHLIRLCGRSRAEEAAAGRA